MNTKRITDVPGLMFLWQVDNLYLAGQPTAESIEQVKNFGVKKIINVRNDGEMDQSDIMAKAQELGMEYEQFPIVVDGQLSKENCEKLSQMINDSDPQFIHCGSANRVGGWLITYLVKYRGMDFEDAVDVASENGLTSAALIPMAQDIIES